MFGESYSPWDSYMLIAQKSPALKKCEEAAQDEEDLALAWHSSCLFVYLLQRPEEQLCFLDHVSTEMLESDSRLKEHDLMEHDLMLHETDSCMNSWVQNSASKNLETKPKTHVVSFNHPTLCSLFSASSTCWNPKPRVDDGSEVSTTMGE
jgi:hypothetical protein